VKWRGARHTQPRLHLPGFGIRDRIISSLAASAATSFVLPSTGQAEA
jgi:hypothetical protein